MANLVLVAGTFHGGWYWDPIVPALEQKGHKVFTPTLSGLDPNKSSRGPINLDTHIEDVLGVIEVNRLTDVILVGWSYGGMVITGVADRSNDAVKKLVYLDAQLPAPGQSEWELMPSQDRESMLQLCKDGLAIYPDEWLRGHEPRVQPHPVGTKLQPLEYGQGRFDAIDKVFIYASEWFHDPNVPSPIEPSYQRAALGKGWRLQTWKYGHDLIREAPSEVSSLLILEAAS